MVLVTHGFELTGSLVDEPLYEPTLRKFRFSHAGLYIFFFTSGYLVTKSLLTSSPVFQFAWKRFLRIYPALVIVILLVTFVVGPLFTTLPVAEYLKDPLTYKYLFTASGIYIRHVLPGVFQGAEHSDHGVNGSLWSIALELKLYFLLIMAGILLHLKVKYVLQVMAVLALACFIAVLYNIGGLQVSFNFLNTGLFMLFFAGSICCIYFQKIRLSLFVLVLLFIGWVICIYFFEPLRIYLELAFFAYLTLYCGYSFKAVKLKADLSYGIYIYAFPLTQIFIALIPGIAPVPLILIVIAAVIPVSFLSWHLIEKQALKHKKRYAPEISKLDKAW